MTIQDFKHSDWTPMWSGDWSLLSSSHFGNQETKEIYFDGQIFLRQAIIVSERGRSQDWARQIDLDRVGRYLTRTFNTLAAVRKLCRSFEKETDIVLKFIAAACQREINARDYRRFWEIMLAYYTTHIKVKFVVDYYDPKSLQGFLRYFEAARIYAEPAFSRQEDYIRYVASRIAAQSRYPADLLRCLRKEEILRYFSGSALPAKRVLAERYKKSVLLFDVKGRQLFTGSEANQAEVGVLGLGKEISIRGSVAYPGKAQGIVRVIMDPGKNFIFNPGDILVTGMTRPEFLPLMKKAAAFVTDAGGVLSHAAITAREMKKPCVIGTRLATKVFKDGDRVEVDAAKGIVRKIKSV